MVLAYTVRTAFSKASSRSSSVPRFTQNTDSYLPAKALPKPSSRKLDERTMKGFCPKYSSTLQNCSRILSGNCPDSSRAFSSPAAAK